MGGTIFLLAVSLLGHPFCTYVSLICISLSTTLLFISLVCILFSYIIYMHFVHETSPLCFVQLCGVYTFDLQQSE